MYQNLVLSGGSLKGISFMGSLQFLEDQKQLDSIKNFIGSSFGALMCFHIVLGYKSKEIFKLLTRYLTEYPITDRIDDILKIYSELGIEDGNYIIDCSRKGLHYKYGCNDITFIELAKKSGKNLVVCAANVTKHKTVFFDVESCPDMSVLSALRMSIAIPLLFKPVIYKNEIYVDGGLFNNFPIDYFKQDTNPLKDTIGFTISNTDERKKLEDMPDNVFQYMKLLLYSVFYKINHKEYNCEKNNVVVIDIPDPDFVHYSWTDMKFDIDKEKMQSYFNAGYDAIKLNLLSNEDKQVEVDSR
jgi:NTE family protein